MLKESKASVQEYARKWLEIYKHDAELNTRTMYRHVIDVHLDARKTDVLMCLNAASGKLRTQEQLLLTLKQIVRAAVTDKHIAPSTQMHKSLSNQPWLSIPVLRCRSPPCPGADSKH